MAKRKLSATQKLRNLVKRQIRSMEKRGYRIDDTTKEKLQSASYQTLKSYHKDKYSKLYNEATALSDSGEIVSGSEYKVEERREAAIRGARTRKSRSSQTDDWERKRREQDAIDREKARLYQEGQIVYEQVLSLIDQYPTKGAHSLQRALSNEISRYGKENVLIAMGQSPDEVIEHARTILFYEESGDAIHSAFVDMFTIITGTKISDEEAKDLGDTLDEMTDADSY